MAHTAEQTTSPPGPAAAADVSHVGMYALLALFTIVAWQISTLVYNVHFHPLRRFPGPLLQRASRLPWAVRHAVGLQAFDTQRLHDRYGPVVRIGPDHLSFTDARAWKDIYGHRVGSESHAAEMSKSFVFSKTIRAIPHSIINAGREEHARLRRALSHGFSDGSMRQQEPLIARYVDLLLARLHAECGGGARALNVEAWYNWATFDIVGDLVFGQPFRCLESADYHPWVGFLFRSVRLGAGMVALTYVGGGALVQLAYRLGVRTLRALREYTDGMLRTRLAMEQPRPDLFEGLLKRRDEWDLSFEKLSAVASLLVLAGSETTATLLSGATYLLLTHPQALDKVVEEVRSTFKDAGEINISSVSNLSYMLAVLNESLRLYPPVASSLVRVVPRGGATIADHFVAGGTFVEIQHWSVNHSKENWADPWTFDPERFLRSKEEALAAGNNLDAFQAFNVGPRNCIGRNLAYAEMRLILARVLFDFDLKLADESKDWIGRQKSFALWARIPLDVYMTPVVRP
ncbi:isotrichodermin C-15 hydroxylase [Xylariaceae sp. FL0804]|nr:isotrichodermin C-15 hydroxylase [Xylariaceae sp. FL0804]